MYDKLFPNMQDTEVHIYLKKIKFVVKIVEMLKVGVGTKSSSNQSSSSSFAMLSGTVPYCHSSGKGQP